MNRTLRSQLLASLPPLWPHDILPAIQSEVYRHDRKVIVLDDDPTGTQTVSDLPVLTDWSIESLRAELSNNLSCFYVLTNSRALPEAEACRKNQEIAQNLLRANQGLNRNFVVISRSDSTLRGHFPAEVEMLGQTLFGGADPMSSRPRKELPPILLVPFFEAGGRYTVRDVHYVADGEYLVPVAETEFARDAVFGYRSSNLRQWVVEKSGGRIRPEQVFSISIDDVRCKGPDEVAWKLLSLEEGSVCIGNAARARDLEVLALATWRAEKQGGRFLYRTAASFVAARLGLVPRPLWTPGRPSAAALAGLLAKLTKPQAEPGGLLVVGSHVPRTNQQLDELLKLNNLVAVPLTTKKLLELERDQEVSRAAALVNDGLRAGQDVVVFTGRDFIESESPEAALDIGRRISDGLVQLLRSVELTPRFVLAKGGVTASDLASKALDVKRSLILGQILPGVPVWELGPETKFPGLPYIVFPGNVGAASALTDVVKAFRPPSP